MLPGPLFRVEMVSVARRRRYFLLRVVYGLFALFLLWSAYSTSYYFRSYYTDRAISIQQLAQLAATFFYSFSWLQTIAILLLGPAMAVGTIATERERRTIEYLFTTDLSNAEIVLGKLTARMCLLGQLLLVGLPILFIFRLLGGIPAQLLVVTFVFAASTALLVTSLSICVSVWSERSRDATVRVYVLMAAIVFLPLMLMGIGTTGWGIFGTRFWQATGQPLLDFCRENNPLWELGTAFGNRGAMGANLDVGYISAIIGKQVLVSVAAILLATFAVRRVHLKETTKAAGRVKKLRRWQLPRFRRPLGSDAMLWKEAFAASAVTKLGLVGGVSMALILLTICGFTFYVLIDALERSYSWSNQWQGYRNFFEYLYGLIGFVGSGVLLLLAARSSGLITSEKERDCWLSLLSTPLSGREIVRGKAWGNLYSMRWALLLLAGHLALALLLRPSYIAAALGTVVTFLIMAWYVTNLGLWFSLRSATTMRSMGATLGTLLFTAGGYLFCCCVAMSAGGAGGDEMMIIATPCIPFLLVFPTIAYVEAQNEGIFRMLETTAPIAYGIGMIGYLIVGIVLYQILVSDFDRLAGRTGVANAREAQPRNSE